MYPAQYDIQLYRGDYFEITLRLRDGTWDGATFVPGPYKDLTGWVGQAQIRATPDASTVLATFTVELLDQTVPETKGGVRLFLPDEESAALNAPAAAWDFQLTEPGGSGDPSERVHTYLRGKVAIEKDVTR